MQNEYITFSVFPSVVPADKESEISVRACGGNVLLYDDISYDIQIVPMDESDVGEDETLTIGGLERKRKTFTIKPQNGIIKFKYFFSGEQQWKIFISTKEYNCHEKEVYKKASPHWDWMRKKPENGVFVSVYSLMPDLYERRALKGDLHVHTEESDGTASPALTAAAYRRIGYDFLAITDHALYDMAKTAKTAFDFETDFNLLTGEEIQNGYDGQLHIVCIGAEQSISDIFINDKKRVESEIDELEKTAKIPSDVPKKEYLYRLWAYKTAKKYGGVVIFPHPYWHVKKRYWQVGPKLATAVIENGLCDAFEIMGGGNAEENNLQTALYYDVLRRGKYVPVVGSTDNHSVFHQFDKAATYIFAKDNNINAIKDAILSDYCVAAEQLTGETIRFYGPYRLVRYARFLADFYFPRHTDLCKSSGQIIVDYVQGDKTLRPLIEVLEKRVIDFEKQFFGK